MKVGTVVQIHRAFLSDLKTGFGAAEKRNKERFIAK
jgi:hypothetical protein